MLILPCRFYRGQLHMRKFRRHKGPPKYPIYPKYRNPAKHVPNYSETQVLPQNQSWIHQPSDSYLFRGDHNCSYNIFPYEVDPETEIVINGRYPYATYFSLTVIGQFNQPVASAVDHELIPDPGSTNPFLPRANWDAKNRNYTLKISFTPPPKGSDHHFVPGAGNHIVYAGTLANGAPNIQGLIVLRIYVASIGYDKKTGGVGFPTLTYRATREYKGHLTYARVEKQNSIHGPTGFHDTSQNSNKRKQQSFNDYVDFNNDANAHERNDQDMNSSDICNLTWRTLNQISEAKPYVF